jgi:hypothetical protein
METTHELRDDAHTAARNLIQAELALLREEFRGELRKVKVSALAFGVAGVAGLLGVSALVETLVVSGAVRPWRGLITGLGLLGVAGAAGAIGYRALPGIAGGRAEGDSSSGVQVFG